MCCLQAQLLKVLPSFPYQHSWSTTSRWFVSTSSKRSRCQSETSRLSHGSSVNPQVFFSLVLGLRFLLPGTWTCFQLSDLLTWTNLDVKSMTWRGAWLEVASWKASSRSDSALLWSRCRGMVLLIIHQRWRLCGLFFKCLPSKPAALCFLRSARRLRCALVSSPRTRRGSWCANPFSPR